MDTSTRTGEAGCGGNRGTEGLRLAGPDRQGYGRPRRAALREGQCRLPELLQRDE